MSSQVSNWDVIFTREDALPGSFNIASAVVGAESAPSTLTPFLWLKHLAIPRLLGKPGISDNFNQLVMGSRETDAINYYPSNAQGRGTQAGPPLLFDSWLLRTYSESLSALLLWPNEAVTCSCRVTAVFSQCVRAPGESLPWLQVLPVKPGWHLHLFGPTHSPCLQPGWHRAIQGGFKEEEKDQCGVLVDYLYEIRVTKHLIQPLLDLAINDLFTPHYSNMTAWCHIYRGDVLPSFYLCDTAIAD